LTAVQSPHAIVIVVTAPVLFTFTWALAGLWWAVAVTAASLTVGAVAEWDERRERRVGRRELP